MQTRCQQWFIPAVMLRRFISLSIYYNILCQLKNIWVSRIEHILKVLQYRELTFQMIPYPRI